MQLQYTMCNKRYSKFIHGNPWRSLICGTCLLGAIFITVSLATNTWAMKQYKINGRSSLDETSSGMRITKLTFTLGLWEECKQVTWVKGNDTSTTNKSEEIKSKVITTISCKIPKVVPGIHLLKCTTMVIYLLC